MNDDNTFVLLPEGLEANELLKRMLEIGTVGVIFFDPAGDIIQANETFLRWTGFSRQDLEAKALRWDRLTPPEWMPASLQAIDQLKTNGSTVPYEKEYFRKDGTRVRGLFAAKGLSAHRGVEFILDISDQHRTQSLLTRSEEKFRQLAECAPIGVYQADLQGCVTYANPLAEKVFGMSEQELLGHGWLSRLCPEDAEKVAAEWPAAITENRAYNVEYRLAMPDGEVRIICAHSVMLHSPDGSPFGVVGTVENITARKLAEATLRETEKLAAVGRLAASIAHEINNPLESVTNLLYLARASDQMEEVQHYLADAERELRRVSAISSQTLRFHKQSTVPRMVSVGGLVDEVVAIHQGRILNSRVEVHRQCATDLQIRCLDGEIRQVLNNLIGNAIDAMHPLGGRLLLRCSKSRRWSDGQEGVAVSVADTGHGMSSQVRKKIFDAFYTTKGTAGTGLGLWVSVDIIARHQGSLTVRTTQGPPSSGTVFRMFLPRDGVEQA